MSSIDHELRLALSTGKVQVGSKITVRELRRGRAKLAIVSSNCPLDALETIKNYGKLSEIPVMEHPKDSVDLGTLCGKPFPVSAMVINEPGDSKILDLVKK
ncbi:50S ribosomal protein L30e [Candidatus Bathyarchaeota archaeon]|nr:50S ribosomal protein L30e [Candidatus Bathyarchaeota archaeon]